MAGKKKKRYSMRGKMITVNMGIMLGALLLCGSVKCPAKCEKSLKYALQNVKKPFVTLTLS